MYTALTLGMPCMLVLYCVVLFVACVSVVYDSQRMLVLLTFVIISVMQQAVPLLFSLFCIQLLN